ncbi:MAG: hypothetical protein PHF86_04810 [Candidatus Nanoarchaeia archaeon]|jgi:hypothetical protein|nr:hypothetical protein [Candidatus Nanoarchaeia archaeon]
MLEKQKSPDEELRMRANEIMLGSKGFMLFAVTHSGAIEAVGDTTRLTTVEQLGLEYYVQEFNPIEIDEDEDDRAPF